jgi:hypothetical protein
MAQGSPPREPLGEHDLSLLSAYLDDELSDAERAQLEARLGADAALQAELEALRQTVALVRSLPEIPVPRNFTLDPAQYGRRQTGGWWFSLATPMLAAGASLLVVAVCVGVLLTGGGLGRQAAPLLAPAAGEAPSVAEADFAAEEPAEEEAAPVFEMAEEEPAAEEEEFFAEEAEEAAPALEAPAPTAEIRVEGAETGADTVGEAEGELAAEPEPLPEPEEEEEAVSEEQEAPAEAEAPVEEAAAGAVTRQPTASATPAPQPTPTAPPRVLEATEISQLPEPGPADEAAVPPAEPAAKVDDGEALVQEVPEETTPQTYAPPRLFRVVPLLIGAVIVLGAALLVAGIALTLAKRRR